jgi:putative transposase
MTRPQEKCEQVSPQPGNAELQPGNAELQLRTKAGNAELQLRTKLRTKTITAPEPLKEWHSRGYLPHRDRIGLLQSITFRLADSLPQEKLRALEEELEGMRKRAELELRVPGGRERADVPGGRERADVPGGRAELELRAPGDFEKRKQIEAWLDSGMGCCALRHPRMAAVMQNALLQFDGTRYHLLAWCIMPNHVHVLIEPKISLSKIVQSWKSFTGRWALEHNAELELRVPGGGERADAPGRFWMPDYWDRYIRDAKHLDAVMEYIHNNPVKAGLCKHPDDWQWSSANARERGAPAHSTS